MFRIYSHLEKARNDFLSFIEDLRSKFFRVDDELGVVEDDHISSEMNLSNNELHPKYHKLTQKSFYHNLYLKHHFGSLSTMGFDAMPMSRELNQNLILL